MVTITIDGIALQVEEGMNVLEAALQNGIYIPHLCHHPDLAELGSCRLCVVELEGEAEPTQSCLLRAKDGMVIQTKTERLQKLRTLALELLLAGHPEDCSTCPKYGNCELQTVLQYTGASNARVKRRIKGFKTNEENPLLIHDMNRCVLCGRCVRACRDLRGSMVLQYNKNEKETYVGTLHDKLLKDASCRFCGACAEVCPTGTIRDKIQLLNAGGVKEDVIVPCRAECPAGINIPRYIRYVKLGQPSKAAAVIREKVPFPHSLGYVCTHICENKCKRGEVNEAMSIRELKRYAAEHDTEKIWKAASKQLPDTGKKVAVIGGGPAGLTAALYLRKQGHDVVVKEAEEKAGGMLQYGIPSYRIPRTVIDDEIQLIEEMGVVIETGQKVEKPEALLQSGFDAVVVAVGTGVGLRLPIDGCSLEGVLTNIEFLKAAAKGEPTGMGQHVVVLGGGNVAYDCARTAVRLGAESVYMACLEDAETMPADLEEREQGAEEGIVMEPGQAFERINGEGHCESVTFSRIKSFSFDENHRPVIEKIENGEHTVPCDTVIFAAGQHTSLSQDCGLQLTHGTYPVVSEDLKTSANGVFAAGDCVYGTASVIKAIASGRDVACSVDRYLGGDGDISEVLLPEEPGNPYIGVYENFGYMERMQNKILPAEERKQNFDLVCQTLDQMCAGVEGGRCLQCDLRLQIHEPRLWGDYSQTTTAGEVQS